MQWYPWLPDGPDSLFFPPHCSTLYLVYDKIIIALLNATKLQHHHIDDIR